MIERIAQRAGGFASTTALRWLGALGDSVPEVELPPTKKRSALQRLTTPLSKDDGALAKKALTKGAFAGAVALVSSSKVVRKGVAGGLSKISDSLRTSSRTRGDLNGTSSSSRSNGRSGNGSNGAISQKTRTELYEMAKKLNIPGRSSMTKEQLEKALKKN